MARLYMRWCLDSARSGTNYTHRVRTHTSFSVCQCTLDVIYCLSFRPRMYKPLLLTTNICDDKLSYYLLHLCASPAQDFQYNSLTNTKIIIIGVVSLSESFFSFFFFCCICENWLFTPNYIIFFVFFLTSFMRFLWQLIRAYICTIYTYTMFSH